MSARDHSARQRQFYEGREHSHLQPRAGEHYAAKLAARLAQGLGIGPEHRVLEVGAGFGRFSFELLGHCGSLVALDLSPRALATLESERDRRGIDPARCRTLSADVDQLDAEQLGGPVDFVVGFFFLHHLPDVSHTLPRLAALARGPGRGLGFIEPNRWNPLFALQLACCADMTWAEEKGMFRLSRRGVEADYARAGFARIRTESFGFFPPPLLNRSRVVQGLERWLDARAWLAPVRPLLLLTARP